DLDPGRVRALGLPLDTVIQALRGAIVNLPAGQLVQGRYEVTVRTPGEFAIVQEIADSVVLSCPTGLIRARDVAEVLDTHRDLTRHVRIGGNLGIRLAVRKESEANTAEVARLVMAEVEKVNEAYPQVKVVPVLDQGRYIERSLRKVGSSIL